MVSALGTSPDHPVKVTDLLLSLVSQAASSDKSINEILEKVVSRAALFLKVTLGHRSNVSSSRDPFAHANTGQASHG